ncbi:MAG: NADH-quinone oxidoreductase subunit J [Actinomycetota bacterium]
MTAETAFFVTAALAVVAGVAMVLNRNAVHCALLLVGSQIALAILFLLQGAFFIAALQIIVYAGAIMILFIFVIMLLGVDQKELLIEPLKSQRSIAVGLGVLLISEAMYLLVSDFVTDGIVASDPVVAGQGNVEEVARVLFTKWAFPFEVTSILLVVAVVGVMVLAKRGIGEQT